MTRRFPFFGWTVKKLTGRWARRTYIAVLLIVLALTTAARLRSYLMTRRIQAVLRGLAELRVDQTSEEQMIKTVPYVPRSMREVKVRETVERWYYTEISNESDRLMRLFPLAPPWSWRLAYHLGYRYMRFDASVLVRDGKVARVRYGLSQEWAYPVQASYIVSAKSVHGFWRPYQHGLEVRSQDDERPQYRVFQNKIPKTRYENGLGVIFTNDAPPELTKRAFQLDLSCFWSLRGCHDAREIAPQLQQDAEAIQTATLERLSAGKCPESIIDGRMRYLPDMSVLLLEVTGSRRIEVNEEGHKTEDWFTDYRLKDAIRGRSMQSWKNVRFERTIPSPVDPTQRIANQNWPQTKIGSQVLFFGNMDFYSCQFIPASPSALEIVRKTPVPTKRSEDQILVLQ